MNETYELIFYLNHKLELNNYKSNYMNNLHIRYLTNKNNILQNRDIYTYSYFKNMLIIFNLKLHKYTD